MAAHGYVRYLRDLPALKAAFADLGPKGWAKIIQGGESQHAALARKAWALFVRDYLPDEAAPEGDDAGDIPEPAAKAYRAALKAGRVPAWIRYMGLDEDIRRAAGE